MRTTCIFSVLVMTIVLTAPGAYAFSLDSITEPIGLFTSEVVYQLKRTVMCTEAWVFLYILGDSGYHDYILSEVDEMRAYHTLLYHRTIDPNCCEPSGCIIDPNTICTAVCVDCNQVEQELIEHYE